MKTKKKEHGPSRFTRGEKITAKHRHGRKSEDRRKEEPTSFQPQKPEEGIPTA